MLCEPKWWQIQLFDDRIAEMATPPKLNDFIITDRLGSGTYATVYKAYRKGGPREVVAIKCVKKASLNKVSTENLLLEIELLKTLKHEHIVQLKDFQWDNAYIYVIMEYCSGGDLSDFIRNHRTLSEYHAKRLMQQIAAALEYMRSMNVSHMDLKPKNILLSSRQDPIVKLADFGFAHYLIGEINTEHLRGSPLYMAPEIVTRHHYNPKVDLWSVGVILYECLFGRAPFHSTSFQELEAKIIDKKPIELPYGVQVSSDCRNLLLGLLKRDPEERMSFDEFFAHPFIDLDHKPSSISLQKAIDTVKRAIDADQKNDFRTAVKLYAKAISYFIPAIHYENDPAKKERLRERIQEYMSRAEELKVMMKPKTRRKRPQSASILPGYGTNRVRANSGTLRSQSQPSSTESPAGAESTASVEMGMDVAKYMELVNLCEDHPQLKAAMTVISAAEFKEEQEDFEGALEKYELALGALIEILKEEPKGKRKDLLSKQIQIWMTRAEGMKGYLEVQNLKTEDTSQQEEEEDSKLWSSVAGQCVLQ